MSANKKQIGGSHYASNLQHWDVVEEHGIGYLEGCASKYVSRWRKKNGLQDLEKALHFTEKLIELTTPMQGRHTRYPRGMVPMEVIDQFMIANDLELLDKAVLVGLWRWHYSSDLQRSEVYLNQMIDEVKRGKGETG